MLKNTLAFYNVVYKELISGKEPEFGGLFPAKDL
jgi:hypothetical protein